MSISGDPIDIFMAIAPAKNNYTSIGVISQKRHFLSAKDILTSSGDDFLAHLFSPVNET